MKSKKSGLWLLVLVLGLVLAVGTAWAQDTIKVGVVGPRTGSAAATGKAFEEGIKLGTDYVNAKGGVLGKKLEIVFEDTAGAGEGGIGIRTSRHPGQGGHGAG